MTGLRFGLLGPLEAVDGVRACTPTAPRLRTLLALLLVRANTVVSRDEMIEELWGTDPPVGAANTLQVFIRRLRGALVPDLGPRHPEQVLCTSASGYSLRLEPDQVDVSGFERCLTEGRRAARDGDSARAASWLWTALRYWRGPALADVASGSVLEAQASALEEARLAALEERIEVDLRLARHRELVAELRTLAARHPLREGFWRLLMVALYRCGRQAEALEVYQELRAGLVSELGLEPGGEVRRVQRAILAGDPDLELLPGSVEDAGAAVRSEGVPMRAVLTEVVSTEAVPTEPVLTEPVAWPSAPPAGVADFTGRTEPLCQVSEALLTGSDTAGSDRVAAPVVVVSGKPGVGKTTLAVHVAHRLRDAFPDGCLYANLRGAARQAGNDVADTLVRFLRALGCDGTAIPDSAEERGELYRARLTGRRVLVVLDDAADERQVRPLLPGRAGAVLVTSRRRLPGLEGAVAVDLPLFSYDEAVELLGRLAGRERVVAEPGSARQLSELCGLLPIAVRVAGAKLAARPHWSVADLTRRLADERHRLGELCAGDLDVRASFALGYQACTTEQRRAFRLLAAVPAANFPAWVAAAACDTDRQAAEALVEHLVDVQLLQVAGRDGMGQLRYQFHDLLKVFAVERLEAEEPDGARRAALARVLAGYCSLARDADEALRPGRLAPPPPHLAPDSRWRPDPELAVTVAADPVCWFVAERSALAAAVTEAHAAGLYSLAFGTAAAMVGFFDLRSHWDDWNRVSRLAVAAATQADDRYAIAFARHDLGLYFVDRDHTEEAALCLRESIEVFEQLGCDREAGYVRCELALNLLDERRIDEALALAQRCLEVFAGCGDRRGEAFACRVIGNSLRHQGRIAEAVRYLDRSLGLFRSLGDRRWEAYLLLIRAGALEHTAQVDRAGEDVTVCLRILRSLDDRRWEAFALRTLGNIRCRQERFDDAAVCYQGALAIMRRLGDRRSEGQLARSLGDLYRQRGRLAEARELLNHSLEIFHEFRDGRGRPLALLGLAGVARAEGRHAEAVDLAEHSLALLRRLSVPFWEARALTELGEVLAATGEENRARRRWHEALAIFREIGASDADRITGLLRAGPRGSVAPLAPYGPAGHSGGEPGPGVGRQHRAAGGVAR